jgi:hypothetical protein
MTTLQTLTFILALGLFSCNGKTENSTTKNENVLSDKKKLLQFLTQLRNLLLTIIL